MIEGKRLKQVRKRGGDTQEVLAEKLGVSTATVSKWEQESSSPNLQTFETICRMYDVSSDYLLGLSPVNRSVAKPMSPERQKVLDEFLVFLDHIN